MAPLFEFKCLGCQKNYEELTSHHTDSEVGKCPHCGSEKREKVIQAFRVGGRGDLRETTLHGCHEGHPHHDESGGGSDDGHEH